MAVAGPWIDPPEHTEVMWLNDTPEARETTHTGAVSSGLNFRWQDAPVRASHTDGQAADAVATVPPSMDVWAAVLGKPMSTALGIRTLASVQHEGTHVHMGGTSYTQADSWRYTAALWDIWQAANPTPPVIPPGAINIEFDGPRQPITLTGLTLQQNGSLIPQWGWSLAPTGHSGETFGPGDTPSALGSGRPGWSGTGGGWEWDADEIAVVQSYLSATSVGRLPRADVRWPALALAWVGGYPGSDPTTVLAHGPYELNYTALPTVQLEVRFRTQRHRFIYPETDEPSARRTYPRHDSLAGGGARTFPPSRASQTSSRTSGSYL